MSVATCSMLTQSAKTCFLLIVNKSTLSTKHNMKLFQNTFRCAICNTILRYFALNSLPPSTNDFAVTMLALAITPF
jgi:hypothetical protein